MKCLSRPVSLLIFAFQSDWQPADGVLVGTDQSGILEVPVHDVIRLQVTNLRGLFGIYGSDSPNGTLLVNVIVVASAEDVTTFSIGGMTVVCQILRSELLFCC